MGQSSRICMECRWSEVQILSPRPKFKRLSGFWPESLLSFWRFRTQPPEATPPLGQGHVPTVAVRRIHLRNSDLSSNVHLTLKERHRNASVRLHARPCTARPARLHPILVAH
ncbi:hypothetical protein BURKHO8Y_170171 [Burkholderia sp. 8Y]|nr:hypothetical protein BURKHO8Y_170171 [Burkholderia sp. 8Y]